MKTHETYMKQCLDLAKLGFGNVAPNPMVGCVIVHRNIIIGTGYHQKCGEAHAEVNAINSVKNKNLLKDSTLYVNLEPCAHYGKTPPCSNLIIEHKIPNVVIGCIDSFSEVSGKGIAKMVASGIKVNVGVLEKESLELNKRFFTFHNKKRPYIILKWAQTIDGFIDVERHCEERSNLTHKDGNTSTPLSEQSSDNWITTPASKKLVHQWRSEEQAIMVGTNTALNDNPQLNVREIKGKNPLRIVLDLNLRLPEELHLFDKSTPTLVLNGIKNEKEDKLEFIKIKKDNLIQEILNELYKKEIQSVIIEGGAQLLTSFINQNLWDEARVFTGIKKFEKGLKAPVLNKKPKYTLKIGTDILNTYINA